MERLFKLKENNTSITQEVTAGFTLFTTIAYIIFVNPQILSVTGMDFGSVMVATIIAAASATLYMGLVANYPFALAPGMGMNAYFTYTVVLNQGHTWQVALGVCLLVGISLVVFNFLGIRALLIDAIPFSIRIAVTGGIGFFLAFIALQNIGVVKGHEATLLTLGNIATPEAGMAALGFAFIAVMTHYRVNGAIFYSILLLWALSLLFGLSEWHGIVSMPPSISPTFWQFDLLGALDPELFPVVFAFVFVATFDATGTLIALAEQGKFLDDKGQLPRAKPALFSDAIGSIVGAFFGTSTVTTFIESAAGIAVGGRTGLTAVVVAFLLLCLLFFSPFIQSLPLFATAPALLTVGVLMMREIIQLNWDDPTEFFPAFIVLIAIPLTFSIGSGIAFGFIFYPVIKLCCGKVSEVHWLTWILALLFLLHYLFL